MNARIQMGYNFSKQRLSDPELWGVNCRGKAIGMMNSLVYRLEKALGDNITWIPETSEIIIEVDGYELPDKEELTTLLGEIEDEVRTRYIRNDIL
jgi:hypothetical protein